MCKDVLKQDPFSGWVFVFRNRPATALKALIYDGQGFWLCHKRLSRGHFCWWPTAGKEAAKTLAAHQLQVLLSAGNPEAVQAAPVAAGGRGELRRLSKGATQASQGARPQRMPDGA